MTLLMLLEVIATSVRDAVEAEKGGADRLELISAFAQGGLTPDIALVAQIVRTVTLPVHVMIRPHSRTFEVSREDLAHMTESMKALEAAGASAFVLGAITADKKIDEAALDQLLAVSRLPVTFHRAFDALANQETALADLQRYPQIRSVLTSGGAERAPDAVAQFQRLLPLTRGGTLRLLAGGGLTPENVQAFAQVTGVSCVHFGTGVRAGRRIDGGVDRALVRQVRERLDAIGRGG
ncbi:copper homeostasis protein CutC [Paenibacillus whitsoniae]|uniref:copper homeostasis protein CutC n=1 Tax=Paenibacillus whitsoniae TaxID=2496558 RepID=UPI0013DEF2D5|nr:copper homeostasis protein CutC [Paenibacillus whitsoniae]